MSTTLECTPLACRIEDTTILRDLDLAPRPVHRRRSVEGLSGGEAQRVVLARAPAGDPAHVGALPEAHDRRSAP